MIVTQSCYRLIISGLISLKNNSFSSSFVSIRLNLRQFTALELMKFVRVMSEYGY